MAFRIAIGGISHETNTFCKDPTPVEVFHAYEWLRGDEILARHRGNRTYIGGMLAAVERLGHQALPTFATTAVPSGTITRAAFDEMLARLLDGLRRAGPLDAVCLALHGAGVAEGDDDIEGTILAAVRDLVGPDVPVAATLDLHGNVTPRMVQHATGLFGVNFYPHTDSFERGVEAVEFLDRVLRRELNPRMALEIVPMMIPPSPTGLEPMQSLNRACWEWEKRPGMIDCTIFHGFTHTDIPDVHMAVVAIADGDRALAEAAARDVKARIWAARAGFRPQLPGAAEAIRIALETDGGPVVINETADNPGGGAPGDATHLLRAMLEAGLENACFGFIYDPEVAEQAHQAGVGATIQARLGGKTDDLHGAPLEITAYVKALTDGRFVLTTPMGRGSRVDLGRMARLVVGGVDILVSSRRTQVFDPEVFLLHGIDVTRYKIVALKSSAHFRAGFEPIAKRIVTADTPGLTTTNLKAFPYKRVRRPIWPLDEGVELPA